MKSMVPTIDLAHIRGNTSPRVQHSRKGSSNVFFKMWGIWLDSHQYARFCFSYTLSFKDALTSCPIAAPGTRCLEGSGESQIADHNITTISSKTTGMNPLWHHTRNMTYLSLDLPIFFEKCQVAINENVVAFQISVNHRICTRVQIIQSCIQKFKAKCRDLGKI